MTEREASREKFEEFAKTDPAGFLLPTARYDAGTPKDGDYAYGRTEAAWLAWQASRQQALEESALICAGISDGYRGDWNVTGDESSDWAAIGSFECETAIRSLTTTGDKA